MLGDRIKERRKAAHVTQQALGDMIGFAKGTVCGWEKGLFKPDVDTIEAIADALNTTAGYLLGYTDDPENYDRAEELDSIPGGWAALFGADTEAMVKTYRAMEDDRARERSLPRGALPIRKQRVPMLGKIHAGEPTYAEQEFEHYVEASSTINCDFALQVEGDSMSNARILDGDIVFIRRQERVADGDIAAVLLDDDTTLKRIRYLPGGMVMLMPENPSYAPIIVGGSNETRNVRILGKAVAFQSNVR